jgi:hypothetical protein
MAKPSIKPRGRDYTEPLRSKLPALEQNVLKHRAINMILVMFYAEDLKNTILGMIHATDRIRNVLNPKTPSDPSDGAQPTTKKPKNPVNEALKDFVANGGITEDEKKEVVALIDLRNFIAHQVENLLSHVGGPYAHRDGDYRARGVPEYEDSAVKRLRHFRKRFSEIARTHHYAVTLTFAHAAFEAAEKTYLLEIKRLQRKVTRLVEIRRAQIKKVNAALDLAGTGLAGDDAPDHPVMRHCTEAGFGRLTKRGTEAVYKLFDLGKSPMAVAHLTGLSLAAVRKRRKTWRARASSPRQRMCAVK